MNMNSILPHIIIVIVPLIVSNTLHMIVVKRNLFDFLNSPISNTLFGKNKTWRGFIFIPFCNALALGLLNYSTNLTIEGSFYLGAILGLSYVLFELPNSFIKRKLGILPGEHHERYSNLFSLIDKMDSAFGVCLVYFILGYVSFNYALILFLCSSLTHMLISKILVIARIKKSY